MVSNSLRQDVQDVIAPDIANVSVKYGTRRVHVSTAPAAGITVALRIARKLRARGHSVTGPDTVSPTYDLYVQEAATPTTGAGEEEADEAESSGLLLVRH